MPRLIHVELIRNTMRNNDACTNILTVESVDHGGDRATARWRLQPDQATEMVRDRSCQQI